MRRTQIRSWAVFSHGDVIRTLLAHFTGTALDLFQRVQISTGSVEHGGTDCGNHPVVFSVNVLQRCPCSNQTIGDKPRGWEVKNW